jgi:hypothetical protein
VASGGARLGAGHPLGARNRIFAEQRIQVQKRFPTTLLMRIFEIIFAPEYEMKEVLVKKQEGRGKDMREVLVKEVRIVDGPTDSRRDKMLIAALPFMHPRLGSIDPDDGGDDQSMGPYLIDLSKLTEEERLQMQTAAAILEPLYRKAQLRITNGNANGNGNGNEHPSEHSASTVASGPDQADHVPVQHQSGAKPRSSRKA